MGGEAEEYLGQINGSPSKGYAAEKGEPNTVRASKRLFYDLQVLGQLMGDTDPPLQPVHPTQIALDRYGLGDAYKGVFGSGLYMPK